MLKKITLLSLLCITSVWAGQTVVQGSGAVSHYSVQRAVSPILIDGNLNEYAWERAAQINQFERILNNYDAVEWPTHAKMLWDDEYFYFAFTCADGDMWAIYDQEDDKLWEEEVVEVFIDPDGDGRNYLELEVSPTNTVVDLLIHSVEPEFRSSVDWDIEGLKTAVQTYGTVNDNSDTDLGWSVEIAIPWSSMAEDITGGQRPTPGTDWRLNLYRIERKAGRQSKMSINEMSEAAQSTRQAIDDLWERSDAQPGERSALSPQDQNTLAELEAVLQALSNANEQYNEKTEYNTWSETFQRGFHHPARFGVVNFAP